METSLALVLAIGADVAVVARITQVLGGAGRGALVSAGNLKTSIRMMI